MIDSWDWLVIGLQDMDMEASSPDPYCADSGSKITYSTQKWQRLYLMYLADGFISG